MNEESTREVLIRAGRASLAGTLSLPVGSTSVVIFAHGSGSSRLSSRNRFVSQALNKAGLGTLLFDLLTAEEESIDQLSHGSLRFDIGFLAERLLAATGWIVQNEDTRLAHIGYFGASTGAAAALVAAAELPRTVNAIVCRGGRPDLAAAALELVEAPTLFIVGQEDHEVLKLNKAAYNQMKAKKAIQVVAGATHLFEEPGKLEIVASLAIKWFESYLLWGSKPQTSTAS